MIRLYALGGAALVALALLAGLLYYRGEAIRAGASEAKAVAALSEANDTISTLQEQDRFNNLLTASLTEQLKQVNANLIKQNEALTELEKINEAVHAYLNAVVPDDLRKLYEH